MEQGGGCYLPMDQTRSHLCVRNDAVSALLPIGLLIQRDEALLVKSHQCARHDVAVARRLHLVDAMAVTEVIKLAEELIEELHDHMGGDLLGHAGEACRREKCEQVWTPE